MDELKKSIAAMTPQVAFIINALFAVLFLVFFLFMDILSYGDCPGTEVLSNSEGFLFSLVWLSLIVLPLLAVIMPLIKKTLVPTLIVTLIAIYLTFIFTLTATGEGLGVGSILNIIIVLAPWICFSYLRKGMPVGL